MNLPGTELTASDLDRLARSAIPSELACRAMLRRVTSIEGGALVGRNGSGDCAGIIFPYIWPGEQVPREYRLRRDHPEYEQQADDSLKERNKYLTAPGGSNRVYFVPGTPAKWLSDTTLPVVLTEGEKKCLALWGLAHHGLSDAAEHPRWLQITLPGVWNFRGSVGKTPGPDGGRRDVKGVISDLERIAWKSRKVIVAFDSNVRVNPSVQAARWELSKVLRKRGAVVRWVAWPVDTPDGVNGIDDFVALKGHDTALKLIESAQPAPKRPFTSRDNPRNPESETQSQRLSDVVFGKTELFRAPDERLYATVRIAEHGETWPVRSQGFRRWLVRQLFIEDRKPVSASALQDVLQLCEAQATFEGPIHNVGLRVLKSEDAI